MHGPKLRDGRQFKKAILHAIIDDASRYVVSARFYFKETVEVLITEMMIATPPLRDLPALLHRQRPQLRQFTSENRLRQARHPPGAYPRHTARKAVGRWSGFLEPSEISSWAITSPVA